MLVMLLLGLGYGNAQAQDSLQANPKELNLNISAGYSYGVVRDAGMSSLTYGGAGIHGGLALEMKSPFVRNVLTASFDYQLLNTLTDYNGSQAYHFMAELNYARLYNLSSDASKKWRWAVGGIFRNEWSLRQHLSFSNNNFINDFYSNLRPVATLDYHFHLFHRQFIAQGGVDFPVFGYVVRPIYTSTTYEKQINNDENVFNFLKSGQFTSLNKFRGMHFHWQLTMPLRNANQIRVGYDWDYQKYDGLNPVQIALHQVSFTLLFNLR